MKYYFSLFIFSLFIYSCNEKPAHHLTKEQKAARMDSLKSDLLRTDIAFSQLSEEKGRNSAFIEYADSGATMLRRFSMPINGRDSIIGLFGRHPDSTIVLSWIPMYADVARSGDLGYTFGTYSITIKDDGKAEKAGGTYCTIWRKDQNNQWKYKLGTGNPGLKAEDDNGE
jgi:ketosteroid isomerase-like protein